MGGRRQLDTDFSSRRTAFPATASQIGLEGKIIPFQGLLPSVCSELIVSWTLCFQQSLNLTSPCKVETSILQINTKGLRESTLTCLGHQLERDRTKHLSIHPSSASTLELEDLGLNSNSSKNYDKGIHSGDDDNCKKYLLSTCYMAGTQLCTLHRFTDLILPTTLSGRDYYTFKVGKPGHLPCIMQLVRV